MTEEAKNAIPGELRYAKNMHKQIGISAQLHSCSQAEIREIGVEAGVLKPGGGASLKTLYDEGMTDAEISQKTGVSRANICAWRHAQKLPLVNRLGRAEPTEPKPAEVPPVFHPVVPLVKAHHVGAEPAGQIVCSVCGKQIGPAGGVLIYTAAQIGGKSYPICPSCARAVIWAREKMA